MKTYALVGAGGYIAPKHMKAIKETGGELLIAYDWVDSVGILDTWAPDCFFTTNEQTFWGLVKTVRPDFVVICVPNDLHENFMVTANHLGLNVICEKPLFLPKNIDHKPNIMGNAQVFPILQLRVHPEVERMKWWWKLNHWPKEGSCRYKTVVNIDYITVRGNWYQKSWKYDRKKSGGLVFNIGIHLLDMVLYVMDLGTTMPDKITTTWIREDTAAQVCFMWSGLEVIINLSLDREDLPEDLAPGQKSYRHVNIDTGTKIADFDFDSGFTDLHTAYYRNILSGTPPTITDSLPAIQLAYLITENLYGHEDK